MTKRKIINSLVILFQGVLLMSCTVHTSKAEIINWDVDAAYGITTEGINQAINDARDPVSYTHLTLPTICSV